MMVIAMNCMVYNTKANGERRTLLSPVSLILRTRYSILLAAIFTTSFLLLYMSNSMKIVVYDAALQTNWDHSIRVDHEEHTHSFAIKTEGCTIPALKPFDPAIIQYVEYPEKAKNSCGVANTTLLKNNNTHIWVIPDTLSNYNKSDELSINCCYQTFYRPDSVSDLTASNVDERITYKDCINFNKSIKVGETDEFVRVKCHINNTEVYKQLYLFVPKKKYMSHDDSTEFPKNKTGYNVIVLGIDGVSRLNFLRTMPKTVSWLKHKGAVDLQGYNKVADNTYPNLIPVWLGVNTTEIKKLCLPHNRGTFDNCPFVWEWFKQAGYYTALGEDNGRIGVFNYLRNGFVTTPVDYYLHPFVSEADSEVGKNRDFNAHLCMQDQYFYKVLLKYVEDLTITLKSNKLFGFFWEISMSHDYLNYPMLMDDSYVETLQRIEKSNYLENTILVVMSDHGIRWGDIRSTKQGRLEERLPFVFILTPQSFRDRYNSAFKNLKFNSYRLTTPFDLHETLSDLVDLDNIENNKIDMRVKKSYHNNRGISLFLPISGNRTCTSAGVKDHWCTCHRGHKVDSQSQEAKEAGNHLLQHLNSLLKHQIQCAFLSLDKILEVIEMIGNTLIKKDNWREFLVVVKTEPGGGVFEATVRQNNNQWYLSGTASRLNLYGEQSHCVDDSLLKLYCYCNDLLNQVR